MKSIKKLLLITVALLLIGPTISAQYSKMIKGQVCPFDTAVAIQINQYRLESKKLKAADKFKLVADSTIKVQRYRIDTLMSSLDFQQQRIEVKDSLLNDKKRDLTYCEKNADRIQTELDKKNNWWHRNEKYFWGTGGFIIGITPIVFILKK
jgi:hypothetical protein